MDEIKVKVKNKDLIKPKLTGVFFLLQGETVIFIGENKDIKRQVEKLSKKGLQFDSIGISPYNGSNKRRRQIAQLLIRKYAPKHNKVRKFFRRKGAYPEKQKHRQTTLASRQKKRQTGPSLKQDNRPKDKTAQTVTPPQSNLNLIKPDQTISSDDQAKSIGDQAERPTFQELARTSGREQTTSSIFQKDQNPQNEPDLITKLDRLAQNNYGQPSQTDTTNIIPEAKETLIQWTKSITEEAYEEMSIDEPDPQVTEEGRNFPNWLDNLANEPITDEIAFGPNNLEQSTDEIEPIPSLDDSLPAWTQEPTQQRENTPAADQSKTRAEEDSDIPEWMRDIDMSKSDGDSVTPFSEK